MTIQIFNLTADGNLETISMQQAGISKIHSIIDPMDSEKLTSHPIAEIRGKANGNVDIAKGYDAKDGHPIFVAVPKGQQFVANF